MRVFFFHSETIISGLDALKNSISIRCEVKIAISKYLLNFLLQNDISGLEVFPGRQAL